MKNIFLIKAHIIEKMNKFNIVINKWKTHKSQIKIAWIAIWIPIILTIWAVQLIVAAFSSIPALPIRLTYKVITLWLEIDDVLKIEI